MSTTLRAAREALQAKLATINGTGGGYARLDLSASDKVKVGRFSAPWVTPPCACLFLSAETAEPVTTRSHDRRATFGVAVYLLVTATTPEDIEDAVEDVYEDLRRRFRTSSDRSLGDTVHDVELELADVIGPEETRSADLYLIGARVTLQFREATS